MFSLKRVQAVRPTPIIDREKTVLPPDDIVFCHTGPVGPTVVGFTNLNKGDEVFICDFDVTPELASSSDNVRLELEIRLPDDSVLLSGTGVGKSQSSVPIIAKLATKPQQFERVGNDKLRWYIKTAEDFVPLDTSGLDCELYFLTHNCEVIPRFQGVPLTALRYISEVKESASADPVDIGLTKKVFNFTPPKYDCYTGTHHYIHIRLWGLGEKSVIFYFGRYLAAKEDPDSLINCYDTASVLQFYFFYAGYPVANAWTYLSAFGYLKQTDVIGRGQCNNPFYLNEDFSSDEICSETDSSRSGFATHSALLAGGIVWDACMGPYMEDSDDYISSATDTDIPNPPNPLYPTGTTADMSQNPGVFGLDHVISSKADMALPCVEEFVGLTGFDWGTQSPAIGFRPVRSPLECSALRTGDWGIRYEELLPGYPEAQQFWRLRRTHGSITLSITVASDGPEKSRHRFLNTGSIHQMPRSPFMKGPTELGEFSAVVETGVYRRYFWVHGNTMVDLEAHSAVDESLALARWVQEMIADPATLVPLESLPPLSVDVSATDLNVNEKVTITGGSQVAIDIDGNPKGLRYAHLAPGSITLIADAPTQNAFNVWIVERATLRTACQRVEITVRGE